MERDLWRCVVAALKRVPRTRPQNAVYNDREIVAVLLWAVLHDRPVSWGCRRKNWPMQAWRRRLPGQSTMSRRMHRCEIISALRRTLMIAQGVESKEPSIVLIDGKALEVSDYSRDPDARWGYGVKGYAKGYRLHTLIDENWRVLASRVRPLNEAECTVAQGLLRDAVRAQPSLRSSRALMLGDAQFDSNPLHLRAATLSLRLLAPRRKPTRGIAKTRRHHRGRLTSISVTEGPGSAARLQWFSSRRGSIERFFGALASAGTGLSHLPSWVRRQHRCDLWVAAKLVINAARIRLTGGVHA